MLYYEGIEKKEGVIFKEVEKDKFIYFVPLKMDKLNKIPDGYYGFCSSDREIQQWCSTVAKQIIPEQDIDKAVQGFAQYQERGYEHRKDTWAYRHVNGFLSAPVDCMFDYLNKSPNRYAIQPKGNRVTLSIYEENSLSADPKKKIIEYAVTGENKKDSYMIIARLYAENVLRIDWNNLNENNQFKLKDKLSPQQLDILRNRGRGE